MNLKYIIISFIIIVLLAASLLSIWMQGKRGVQTPKKNNLPLIHSEFSRSFYEDIFEHGRKIAEEFARGGDIYKKTRMDTNRGIATEIICISSERLILKFKKDNQFYVLRRVVSSANTLDEEFEVAKNLSHPNIMKIYSIKKIDEKNIKGVETITYIVSEYLDVEIDFTFVNRNEEKIKKIIMDVSLGLEYLHDRGIAHLDIKINNIMGKRENDTIVYKILDFGYSRNIKDKKNKEDRLNVIIGTNGYHANEVFFDAIHGIKSDLWSLGCIAWYLSSGNYMFMNTLEMHAIEYTSFLKDNKMFFTNNTSEKLREFIMFCMNKDRNRRPDIKQVMKHRFLSQ
jgi:serine/threonine protein kinase